jgi:dienelactone hydrolase
MRFHRHALLIFSASIFLVFTTICRAQEIPVSPENIRSTTNQLWRIETIPVRTGAQSGEKVTMAIAMRLPPENIPLQHIVLAAASSAEPLFKIANGTSASQDSMPWIRTASELNARGIAVAFADVPSDANHRTAPARPLELRNDLQKAVQYLAARYPHIPIHIGGFSLGAISTLDALGNIDGIGKAVIVSGAFLNARDMHWRNLKTPVMLVHAPSAQCDNSPFIEADIVARQNNFKLVSAGYEHQEIGPSCARGAQSRLTGLDQDFAQLVADWLNGATTPSFIGYAAPQIAWREKIVHYTFDSLQLEMTLLLPDGTGPGPYPVAIFNHGDIEISMSYIRYHARFREMIVAREFLRQGIAVAMPARPGIGMSEGVYSYPGTQLTDADASYRARVHTRPIMPAIEYLRQEKELDSRKMIVVGQSAGAYATMYIASQNPPGVIGAINFAGGRSDHRTGDPANFRNPITIEANAEFGKTTHIPVLMIYAENDSRGTANTIRLSHEAFVHSGGTATLVLTPPLAVDGHYLYHYPDLWRDAFLLYLRQIKAI